jgi:hypothetical protein
MILIPTLGHRTHLGKRGFLLDMRVTLAQDLVGLLDPCLLLLSTLPDY